MLKLLLPATALALTLPAPFLAAQAAWTVLTPANSPSPRGGHGASTDGANMLVFGGNLGGGTFSDELWRFDGTNWQDISPATGRPAGRDWHGQAFDVLRNRLVVFGGHDAAGVYGDTWEFDGTTWTQQSPVNAPAPRDQTAMAYDFLRGRVVLFGGRDAGGTRLNDTWEYDGTNWTQISTVNSPSVRSRHNMVFDLQRGVMVMHGGVPAGGGQDPETWTYDGSDWTQVMTPNPPFGTGLFQFGMAYDPTRGQVILQGGSNSALRSKTFSFDGSDWTDRGNFLGQGLIARTGNAMVYVPALGKVFNFGGFNNAFLNDTYEWSTSTPAGFVTSGTGCAGSAGTPGLVATTAPWAGDTLQLSATPVSAASLPFLLVGISNQTWGGGSLPASLAFAGAPNCQLYCSPDVGVPTVVQGAAANWSIALPDLPAIYGGSLYFQSLFIEGFSLYATGLGTATIGAY